MAIDYQELERLLKDRDACQREADDHEDFAGCHDCDIALRARDKLNRLAPTLAREILDRQRWIPTEEAIPAERQSVLAIPRLFPQQCDWDVAQWYEDGDYPSSEGADAFRRDYTHWKPLDPPPAPPFREDKPTEEV